MNNEEKFAITEKGKAFQAYLVAQQAAADSGIAYDMFESLGYFESEIYAPVAKYVKDEVIRGVVEDAFETSGVLMEEPSLEGLTDVAMGIGIAFLELYEELVEDEGGQDA